MIKRLLLFLLLSPVSVFADDLEYFKDHPTFFEALPYKSNEAYVEFYSIPKERVDWETFQVLGDRLAHDRYHFYNGSKSLKKIEQTNLPSIYDSYLQQVMNGNQQAKCTQVLSFEDQICRNEQAIYWAGREMREIDRDSYQILNRSYSRDKNRVFYHNPYRDEEGYSIPDADSSTFKVISDDWAKDASTFYFKGEKIDLSDEIYSKLIGDNIIESKIPRFKVEKENTLLIEKNEEFHDRYRTTFTITLPDQDRHYEQKISVINISSFVGATVEEREFVQFTHFLLLHFSGEACGIPSQTFYYGWDGKKLHYLIKTTGVGDADLYGYSEKLFFYNDYNRAFIIKVREETWHNEESDDYKERRKVELWEWKENQLREVNQSTWDSWNGDKDRMFYQIERVVE